MWFQFLKNTSILSPRVAQRDVAFKRSGHGPSFIAFMLSVLRRNFCNIASKQTVWSKSLVKPFHTIRPACCKLVAHLVGTMVPRGPCLSPYGRAGTGGRQGPGRTERRDQYGAQSCLLHTRQVFAQPSLGAGEACARGAPRSPQGRPCFRLSSAVA